MRIRELAELAARTTTEQFAAEVGPFALIERPPSSVFASVALAIASNRTVGMASRSRMANEILAMVTNFSGMRVQRLPGLQAPRELCVGRASVCDVVVLEPSVSKRHALLRWDPTKQECTLKDLSSTNGTFINANEVATQELALVDGDSVGFGDSLFMYMLAPTLHAQLRSVPAQHEHQWG